MEQARIHIYEGEGKGKSSAALGLLLRAAGAGYRVGYVGFLKPGTSSEIRVMRDIPGVTLFPFWPDVPFASAMNREQHDRIGQFYTDLLRECEEALPGYDVLILDEILDAVATELVPESALLSLLSRGKTAELVLTGRSASPAVRACADYITHFTAVRHPFQSGFAARKGIEY